MKLLQRNRRFLALGVGALIGQGSMLLTFSLLIWTKNPLAGVLTTSLGVSSLLLILIDWGGQIIQRQFGSAKNFSINVFDFVAARIPILMLVIAILVLVPSSMFGDVEVKSFLFASLVGLSFSIFNMSGLLDISNGEIRHGLIAGLNYFFVAIYVLCSISFGFGLNVVVAGWLNGIVLALISLATFRWVRAIPGYKSEGIDLKTTIDIFKEGCVISLAIIPGQLISRAIAVYLLAHAANNEAANFNFIKSYSGVFSQLVVFLRRAEYIRNYEAIRFAASARFHTFKSQYKTICFGSLVVMIGGGVLFASRNLLHISLELILAISLHGTLWLISSSYFNHYQLVKKNWIQPLHAGFVFCAVYLMLLNVNIESAFLWVGVECLVSFAIFLIFYTFDKIKR